MKKEIDLDTAILGFDNSILTHIDDTPLTLGKALIQYLNAAHLMVGFTGLEEWTLYSIGKQIGSGVSKLSLNPDEFKLVERLVDGKVPQAGSVISVYGLAVTNCIKEILQKAPIIEAP